MDRKNVKRAIATVYETYDYSIFRKMRANRAVSEARVKKILASFQEKEILNPIVVNEKYEIVDGQGRYEACKRLGRPIRFVVASGATVDDCRRMNRYNERWTVNEWVESYAQNEDPEVAASYGRFKKVREDLGLPYPRILRMVNKGWAHGIRADKVMSGQLSFTEDDVEKVKRVYESGQDILVALCDASRPNDSFWTAVTVMVGHEKYNHKRMIENCRINRGTYAQMANLENQLKEFSRIYNFKRQKDRIFFDEYMRSRGHNVRGYEKYTENKNDDVSTLIA